ncbi:MAG: hypothetical protein QNJ45_20345 [Ardenticatenaceae bacterium]|nr:hypothetical protein [Ardenticatenaceae bacterium]
MAQHTMPFDRRPLNNNIPAVLAAFWDARNRSLVIATVLALALFAFEIFNFDTTKFALTDLLGETSFMGLTWAAILAFAFCAIDFAGLVKIFTPEQGENEPREVWYLMGAWLLGATMNSIMTWYAVSVLLMQRPLGTEVLTREQLLTYVPIFVAVLVWLTRILFIGSLSVAGEHLIASSRNLRVDITKLEDVPAAPPQNRRPNRQNKTRQTAKPPVREGSNTSRVRRRPPAAVPMSAKPRR